MNPKEVETLLEQDSDVLEFKIDKEKVNEKINKLHAKEVRADKSVYGNKDPKRKFKN